MTTTLQNFVSETQLTATEQTLVSTTSSEKKFIGMATATNTSTSNIEVEVWRVGSTTLGVSGVGGNWILKETIPAQATVPLYKLVGHTLGNSMKLSAKADTANVINIDISGTTS